MFLTMPEFIKILLSYSFRIFFLCGTLFGFLVIATWSLALLGYGPLVGHPDTYQWHAHEMVFGFVYAILAGFALTAVANWTGRDPVCGGELALLVASWLLGRIGNIYAGTWPAEWVGILDMLFPCLFVFLFGREVLRGGNWRNAPLVVMIALLGGLNLLFHAGHVLSPGLERISILLGVHTVLVIVALVGGRVVPSFTANWMRAQGHAESNLPRIVPVVDIAALILTVATGVAVTFAPVSPLSGVIALLAAAVHALRLARWSGQHTVSEPLLFVMHLAYAWFPLGYLLVGISVFGGYMATVALHALTIGAIVGMILAMITRVPLGHTARPLRAARITVAIYVLWMITVLIRLSGPLFGGNYIYTVETAASVWLLLFILYGWAYWPMLIRPRIDQ